MQQFDELAARLLREGVAHRHVRRYVAELRDHAENAAQAEMRRGASLEDAAAIALARLGTLDDLARSMTARGELRAMSAKFPKFWGGGMPVLVWIGILIAGGLILGTIVPALRAGGIVPDGGGAQALAAWQGPADAIIVLVTRVLPVVLGGATLILALRQRTAILWPVIGAGVLAVIAAAVQATVRFSTTPETLSSLNLGVGIAPETALRAGLMFAAMLTPLLLRNRLTRFAS